MGYIMEFMILLSKEMYFVAFCPRGFGPDVMVTYCLILKVICVFKIGMIPIYNGFFFILVKDVNVCKSQFIGLCVI